LVVRPIRPAQALRCFYCHRVCVWVCGRKALCNRFPSPGLGGELGFQVECADEGDRLHVAWRAKGVTIALPPMVLDFGRGFVGLDPDGHRLRVYALGDYK
jgi:hypothetical protein